MKKLPSSSWFGTEGFWEEGLDVVVCIMSVVKLVELFRIVVSGVTIASVGMSVIVNDWVLWVMLELGLFVVISITIGKLIRVFGEQDHVLIIDWVLKE